jgi:hypothetical protein
VLEKIAPSKGDVSLVSSQGKTFQQSLLDSQTDRIQLLTQQLSEKQASEALAQQKLGATQLLLQTTTKDLVVAQLRITELEGETARLRSQLTAAQGTIKPSPSSSVLVAK